MAIVFISPKERQKTFLLAIVGLFVVVLTIIGLWTFLSKPKPAPAQEVFVAPEIKVSFDILKLKEIEFLEMPPPLLKEFYYKAISNKKQKTGTVSAESQEKAQELLANLNMTSIILEEIKEGRANPFTPYYSLSPASNKTKK